VSGINSWTNERLFMIATCLGCVQQKKKARA
jgi:hypothetical protein